MRMSKMPYLTVLPTTRNPKTKKWNRQLTMTVLMRPERQGTTDNNINEEEQKFIGSLENTANDKESLVSNDSSNVSSIFEDDDNDVQKQDNSGKKISEK